MHSSAPWSGVTSEQHPWSFTFDPSAKSASRTTDKETKAVVPEQPSGKASQGSASTATSAVEGAKPVELTPKKMHQSYVEVRHPLPPARSPMRALTRSLCVFSTGGAACPERP